MQNQFAPLFNQFLGLESLARDAERFAANPQESKYPPHNIILYDDNKYIVELAVAGFKEDELIISIEDNILRISGEKHQNQTAKNYLLKGISTKSFVKTIRIADTVEVINADFVDGILSIYLENIIPDHKKPRSIKIGKSERQLLKE